MKSLRVTIGSSVFAKKKSSGKGRVEGRDVLHHLLYLVEFPWVAIVAGEAELDLPLTVQREFFCRGEPPSEDLHARNVSRFYFLP
jgi:hypothetical protein